MTRRYYYLGLSLLSLWGLTVRCGRQPAAPEQKGTLVLRVLFDHDAGSLPKGNTAIDQVTVTVRRFGDEQPGQAHAEGPIVLQQDLAIVVRAEGRFAEGTLKVPLEDREVNCFLVVVDAKERGAIVFTGSTTVCFYAGESSTQPVTVYVHRVGVPTVRISSPANNSTVDRRVVTVTGTIDDPTIRVALLILNNNISNPQFVAVLADTFRNEVILSPGKNTIRVEATNEAGTGFDEITVDFIGPAADIRVTLTWDTPNTDLDLWVTDPNQERVYFEHPVSEIGGELDDDDIDGYGPENFTLVQGKAIRGIYLVQVDYFSGSIPTNARITVTLREGSANQQVTQYGPHLFQSSSDSVWTVTRIQWP